MKQKLIFISVLISLLPLVLFQIYFFYSSEKNSIEREIENDFQEAKYSLVSLNKKFANARSNISLISKLSLLRVSLEFNRPETVNEFLVSDKNLRENFSKIYILDKDKQFFTSSEDNADVFKLIKQSKSIVTIANAINENHESELINEIEGKLYIGRKIISEDGSTAGYLIAELSDNLIDSELSRLKARIKNLNRIFLNSSWPTSNSTYCQSVQGLPLQKYLCFSKDYKTSFVDLKFIVVLLGTSICLAYIFAFIYKKLFNKILEPLNNFLENLQSVTTGKYTALIENNNYPEISELIKTSNQIISKLQLYQKEEIEKVKVLAVNKVAAQAAHDIRSPLEVFRALDDDLRKLPDESRKRIKLAVSRIEEIAYNLLQTNKNKEINTKRNTSEDLLQLILSVNIEKKIEYRNKTDLDLVVDVTNGYGLFSSVNRAVLKSILSNLINNSIESKPGEVKITLALKDKNNFNSIIVKDNGLGIPGNILSKLFKETITSKADGNGLGLINAYNDIKSWHGEMTVKSSELGTEVEIQLPKSLPPHSFLNSLNLAHFDKIVILDDDSEFLNIWQEKLQGFQCGLKLITKYADFGIEEDSVLVISDYDLNDLEHTGLSILQTLPANYTKVLATALAEDESIRKDCENFGLKLIPKNTIQYLPITFSKALFVLIDDDKLIQLNWKMAFDKKGISLKTYFSVEEFLHNTSELSSECLIYIDSDLNGKKGEIESQAIFQKGFKNIILATGYTEFNLDHYPWIQKVVGKAPPI